MDTRKISEKYWEKNQNNCESQSGQIIQYFDGFKENYDKLVSLEAKIEYAEAIYSIFNREEIGHNIKKLESEYQELAKQLQLI